MRRHPPPSVRDGVSNAPLVLLLFWASFPISFAEQPSSGWNDRWPSGARPASPQPPPDSADAWYSRDDQWPPAESGPGDQYPRYTQDNYQHPSSIRVPPGEQVWPLSGDEGNGADAGEDAIDGGSGAKSRRRTRKRGRSVTNGGGENGPDGDNFDEGDQRQERDLVRSYTRSFKGRMVLSGGASVSGAALGAIISESTIHRTPVMSAMGLVVGLILSMAKGAFGDLFRAMGLAIFLSVRRSHRLSAEYPFLPYARRALAMRPRRPFPPADNPWRYKRSLALADMEEAGLVDESNIPPHFSMAKTLLALAFLGGFAGYLASQVTFLPTFLLALGVSGVLSYLATTKNSRGDLARLVGMRTVASFGLVSDIDSDVRLSQKAKVVGGICFSKAMFWDSKYHIKDRIVAVLSNLYAAMIRLVQRVQRDAGDTDAEAGDDTEDDEADAFAGADTGRRGSRGKRRQPWSRSGGDGNFEPRMQASVPPPPPPPPSGFGGNEYYDGGNGRDEFY